MGLIDNSSTLVAPQPRGIIDPNTQLRVKFPGRAVDVEVSV